MTSKARCEAPGRRCPADLTTHGISPHAWAADANGSVLLTVSRGTLANSKLDLGGALEQLFAALNPFRQKDTSTEILCVVARLPTLARRGPH